MIDANLRYAKLNGITVLHENPAAAAQYVRNTMNAVDCDKDLCRAIANIPGFENNGCTRVTAGGLTYQFIKPTPALPGSQEYFAKWGAQLYTYNLTVDDVPAAVQTLQANGGEVVCFKQGEDRLPYNMFFKGEGEPIDYAIVDCRKQCGLMFEIMQKNDQLPNYTGVRFPSDIGCFMHAEIVVEDADASAEWLCRVMGGDPVEQNIAETISAVDGTPQGCQHILMGGFVFQIIFAHKVLTGWDKQLEEMGNSTRLICYHVRETGNRTVLQQLDTFQAWGGREIKIEGDEHGNFWNFTPGFLYGPDGDDPDRIYHCFWWDSVEQCGLNWEILPMAYGWPCHTGYFHF